MVRYLRAEINRLIVRSVTLIIDVWPPIFPLKSLTWRTGTVVSVTRFKDLADEIDGDDPEMKLLLPTAGPVKTNLGK